AACNAQASAMAPALGRGEAVSLALRVPEVVDAIRQAGAGAGAQRVEFSERVPVDRWLAAHVAPLELADASGVIRRLLLMTFHDLTPLRRVEEMRADFVANASHELRTPLASLSGFIDTLQGPARDDPAARERFMEIMKGQARRMARLIDDLLQLSRIELNAPLPPQPTESFYRVDVGHSRAEGGTGPGLALVKHIVNRHRGRLTIESTLGRGAAFAVRLPLSLAPARAETAEIPKA